MRVARRSLLLAAAGVALAGCKKKSDEAKGAPGLAKTTLALDWVPEPEFGGFYAARASGAYARAGLDVDVQGGGAGAPVVQRVAAGQVDFGTVGGDALLLARDRGADVVALFAVFQTSPQAIMTHAAKGFASIDDVMRSGATLAVETGAPYAAWLKKKYGFDKVKVAPYDGGVARFLADPSFAQQCYVTSEPIAAKQKGGDPKVFLVADSGFDPYVTVVVARRALVAEKRDMVRRFVDATREGWRAYLQDPSAADAVMAKLNPAMDAATFAAAADAERPLIETDDTKRLGLGAMTRERWKTLGEQLASLGLVAKAPSPDDVMVDLGAAADR